MRLSIIALFVALAAVLAVGGCNAMQTAAAKLTGAPTPADYERADNLRRAAEAEAADAAALLESARQRAAAAATQPASDPSRLQAERAAAAAATQAAAAEHRAQEARSALGDLADRHDEAVGNAQSTAATVGGAAGLLFPGAGGLGSLIGQGLGALLGALLGGGGGLAVARQYQNQSRRAKAAGLAVVKSIEAAKRVGDGVVDFSNAAHLAVLAAVQGGDGAALVDEAQGKLQAA